MSGHGHHAADAAHDTGHEDETSSDDFPADEPRSPGWLPLLGGALFLLGIFAFVAMGPGAKTAEELAQEAAASPNGAAPAPPASAPTGANPAQRPSAPVPGTAAQPQNRPQFPRGAGN